MTRSVTSFLDPVHYLIFLEQTSQELDLLASSGDEGHLLTHVSYKEFLGRSCLSSETLSILYCLTQDI